MFDTVSRLIALNLNAFPLLPLILSVLCVLSIDVLFVLYVSFLIVFAYPQQAAVATYPVLVLTVRYRTEIDLNLVVVPQRTCVVDRECVVAV